MTTTPRKRRGARNNNLGRKRVIEGGKEMMGNPVQLTSKAALTEGLGLGSRKPSAKRGARGKEGGANGDLNRGIQ
eukprot:10769377-Karenia_brevis.AAC.1